MDQNDNNRDQQRQGEGYQDPNEQESLDTRSDSLDSQPTAEPLTQRQGQGIESDLDDADDMDDLDDEDRDDDQREGGANRRRSIS
jgi:hypothetical protein